RALHGHLALRAAIPPSVASTTASWLRAKPRRSLWWPVCINYSPSRAPCSSTRPPGRGGQVTSQLLFCYVRDATCGVRPLEGGGAMTKVREAAHMVAFVDEYCNHYRALFANVRYCEQFSALHVGLLAETKRKSLPRLAKTAKADAQALHHFL